MYPKPVPQYHRAILNRDLPPGEHITVVVADHAGGGAYCTIQATQTKSKRLALGVIASGTDLNDISTSAIILLPSVEIGRIATEIGLQSSNRYYMTEVLLNVWRGEVGSLEALIHDVYGYHYDDCPVYACDALIQICSDSPQILPVRSNNLPNRLMRVRYPEHLPKAPGYVLIGGFYCNFMTQKNIGPEYLYLAEIGIEQTRIDCQGVERMDIVNEYQITAA